MDVPVLANGNVLIYEDIGQCLQYTGADGVMVAEALLYEPRLFSNPKRPLLTGLLFDMRPPADAIGVSLALEYLRMCQACSPCITGKTGTTWIVGRR